MSEKKEEQKTKKVKLEKAVVVPSELADRIQMAIGEMPMKYNQLWGPISSELSHCHLADVELDVPDKAPVKKDPPEKEEK